MKKQTMAIASVLILCTSSWAEELPLQLRSRFQPFKGTEEWHEATFKSQVDPKKCAVVLCDIWDKHWCDNATSRCDVIAKKTADVVKSLRSQGVFIVHCPSDCMDFYKDSPARARMKSFPKVNIPKPLVINDPPLPIDDRDGGCDDPGDSKTHRAWSRQHPAIVVDEEKDGVSDNGQEVYNALQAKGIDTLIVMGVHTNMCVLHRSFAIKAMTRSGIKCILVRDLTDSMYNPKSSPFVSHDAGTQRVIEHIEKFWCPTCLSSDLKK